MTAPTVHLLDRRGTDLLAISLSGPLWATILGVVSEAAEAEALAILARLLMLLLPLVGMAVVWRRMKQARGDLAWAWAVVLVALFLPFLVAASLNTVPVGGVPGHGCVRVGVLPAALNEPLEAVVRFLVYAVAPLAVAAVAMLLAHRATRAPGAWTAAALVAFFPFSALAGAVVSGCPAI